MSSKRPPKPAWELDEHRLRAAMIRRVERSTEIQADLAFSAIPSLFEHYASRCEALFELAARPLEGAQRAQFRNLLSQALRTGFEASAHAKVVLRLRSDPSPAQTISYEIGIQTRDIADVYATWLRASPEAPHFGTHADAKVLQVAREFVHPEGRALDIGAGTGRNSLPLAQLGLTVDAVELTPGFAAKLREAAASSSLPVNAIEGDAFDPALALERDAYSLLVASEVAASHFRDGDDLREFFEFAADKLQSGGMLVFNAFVARAGYSPDPVARQISPSVLSSIVGEADLLRARDGLPLELISNESCSEYEKAGLPSEAWPPTPWFEQWANGNNLFDLPGLAPCELRWLVYRKS